MATLPPSAPRTGKPSHRLWLLSTCWSLALLASVSLLDRLADGQMRAAAVASATQHALWHKERLAALTRHELDLAMLMARSPTILKWVRDEDEPALRQAALESLNAFRRVSQGGIWSVAVEGSRHYYFEDGSRSGRELSHTMDEANGNDGWYFATRHSTAPFTLDVGVNALGGSRINLWINAIIRDGDRMLGVVTSAIPLDRVLGEFMRSPQPGVSSFLIDRDGVIRLHPELGMIDFNTMAKAPEKRYRVDQLVADRLQRDELANAVAALGAGREQVRIIELQIDGHNRLAAVTRLDEIDWYDVVSFDLESLTPPARNRQRLLALAAALPGVLLAGWAFASYRHARTRGRPAAS